MNTAITVENLSKKYIIGHQRQEKYTALRDVMMHKIRGIGQRIRHPLSPNREETNLEEFWALKDINLEINQGDRVGIIGRNGAGKSTLLKILSRITEPTTGRISINGRVASLLEVGTGFHPELTGRENIFLNGAILGMSRAEIKLKFDEIVDFAEIEKFLDTPVKRYSSGMYVRLAFAVAAHLEPEILMVDEVLAVGDITFQRKCLGKMRNVADTGRTLIFVSHNLSAIEKLCGQVLLFNSGHLVESDAPDKVLRSYLQLNNTFAGKTTASDRDSNDTLNRHRNTEVSVTEAYTVGTEGRIKRMFHLDEPITFRISFRVNQAQDNLHFYARVHDDNGQQVFATGDWDERGMSINSYHPGEYQLTWTIPTPMLNTGSYSLSLEGVVPSIRYVFKETRLLNWQILPVGGVGGMESVNRQGVIRPLLSWQIDRVTTNPKQNSHNPV